MNKLIGINIDEHSQTFMGIADIIKRESSNALNTIELAINEFGLSEEDILYEWNSVFPDKKLWFKSLNELIDYLKNVGI